MNSKSSRPQPTHSFRRPMHVFFKQDANRRPSSSQPATPTNILPGFGLPKTAAGYALMVSGIFFSFFFSCRSEKGRFYTKFWEDFKKK